MNNPRFQVNDNIVLHHYQDRFLAFNLEDGSTYELNEDGFRVLEQCNGWNSVEELYTQLGGDPKANPEEVQQLAAFVEDLIRMGIVSTLQRSGERPANSVCERGGDCDGRKIEEYFQGSSQS